MTEHEYWNAILAINSANLAANLKNVQINEKILANHRDDRIIELLKEILKEVRKNDG